MKGVLAVARMARPKGQLAQQSSWGSGFAGCRSQSWFPGCIFAQQLVVAISGANGWRGAASAVIAPARTTKTRDLKTARTTLHDTGRLGPFQVPGQALQSDVKSKPAVTFGTRP